MVGQDLAPHQVNTAGVEGLQAKNTQFEVLSAGTNHSMLGMPALRQLG
jgi:hypothetical protein